ncbi:restriction endonuclease subunit S [Photobacterium damselae subsp. damselae]|uniref:restriction endonuclease subunit S n=1 Tax=Photobacterium damselae TaxID=38293 RepID=UPI000839F148|nr:restriction endonuclease subunit S [Photobacterium damselae]QSH59229.1 restriction endonuclease subunit S [Photobacterium damselae subsp. damselae]
MVPNGWNLGLFGDGIELISGQHVEAKFVNTVGNGKPYLTGPADFPKGKVIVTKYTKQGKKECVAGDLLITVKGSGTGKVIEADSDYVISRQLMAIRAKKFDSKFCYYNLVSNIKRYEDAAAGLIPGISREDVLNTPLMIPPLPEQRKIAQILIVWDNAIATTEKLIDASKQQKKALMQQLLTGKKRLIDPETGKAFEGDWEEVRLDSFITNFIVPMRDKPKDLSGEIPWCRIEDFSGMYLSKSKSNQGVSLATIEDMNLKVFPKDTLLVSCSADLGRCAITQNELVTNQTFIGLVTNKQVSDVRFLFYKIIYFAKKLNDLSSGTTISYLSRKEFEKFKVSQPAIEEQRMIASVLTAADKEIELLEAKLAHFKQEKKALMQQLLTGKRRVKIAETKVATEETLEVEVA